MKRSSRLVRFAVAAALLLALLSAPALHAQSRVLRQTGGPESTHRLGILVPAYFYPGLAWGRLSAAASVLGTRLVAIANPFNGPGTAFDPNYASAIQSVRSQGGRVIGYVYSSYGNRSLVTVKSDIDQWFAWYGIDGIFIDEVPSQTGTEAYYLALHDHIEAKKARSIIVGNPGTDTAPSFLRFNGSPVFSILTIFEGNTGFDTWQPASWVAQRDRQSFSVLPYNTDAASWQSRLERAWSLNTGWVYLTNDVLPNPWDTLPPYFETLVEHLAGEY